MDQSARCCDAIGPAGGDRLFFRSGCSDAQSGFFVRRSTRLLHFTFVFFCSSQQDNRRMRSQLHNEVPQAGSFSRVEAEYRDSQDPLSSFREQFIIPSTSDLRRKTLAKNDDKADPADRPCIYLCGNSLGLQSQNTRKYIEYYLQTWATKGVMGHFVHHDDELVPPFVKIEEAGTKLMAPIVGALESEVAVMGSLTANVHLLLGSFYRPNQERYKIIMEGKAFPSDHIQLHGHNPNDAMVLIEPENAAFPTLTTEQILRVIDEHASSTAVIFLSAIQYYTGQYFEIEKITAHAQSKGILVGWDCAHAAGNVDLQLHDWNVDFAAWCCYKYLNSGPGGMAAIFVHEKHGQVDMAKTYTEEDPFRPRLCGWWGEIRDKRFLMDNRFVPQHGAAGFQLSNPSALDMNALIASLEIFNRTTMANIRQRSLALTGYLVTLLLSTPIDPVVQERPFSIISPLNPAERGAQLSLRLKPGILDSIQNALEEHGIVIDERKPDVIRVAPAPLYNTYVDVWEFCRVFLSACTQVAKG